MDNTNDANLIDCGGSPVLKPPTKGPKFKSSVWAFFERFTELEHGILVTKNRCGICKAVLTGARTAGTSHLSRHLKMHEKAQAQTGQLQLGPDATGNLNKYGYNKENARKELVDFIIRAELPFTFVEKHDFKGMIQRAFCPQYGGISATTCKRDVMQQFDVGKKELLSLFEKFDGKICLTSDVWSSRQKMGYMSLTAHFIDREWCLNKRIICLKMIEYPHSGESLAGHIFDELLLWRIHKKIFTISLDNATNNDVVARMLPDFLMIDEVPKQLFHVRCCAHILNLIVQDGLVILSPSISKITNIVRSMNSSNKRHELWVRCCKDFNMPKKNIDLDVPHRWNSTYELLQVAIKYKEPLVRYVLKLNETRSCNLEVPTEQDWLLAQLVSGFLAIFASSTKIFSGVYYPTSCRVINCLIDIHASFSAYSEFSVFKDALAAMRGKFDKYWGTFPIAFCFATIMDPRFKLFAIGEWLECMGLDTFEVESKLVSLKTELHRLYETYKRNVVTETETNRQPVHLTSAALSLAPGSISVPVIGNFSMQRLKKAKVSSSYSTYGSSDLQMYFDLPTIEVDDDSHFSVLGWWKANEQLYPVVSLMARDLLTIPASTVASESCFSAGGRVVSEKRAALSPSTIEALICLKDWSSSKSRNQDAIQEELFAEDLVNTISSRPDWMLDIEEEAIIDCEPVNDTGGGNTNMVEVHIDQPSLN